MRTLDRIAVNPKHGRLAHPARLEYLERSLIMGVSRLHLSLRERVDLRLHDVTAVDLVSEVREAGRRDQPDPACADHPEGLPPSH